MPTDDQPGIFLASVCETGTAGNIMNVSREVFPWSIIVPQLERNLKLAQDAENVKHAESLLGLWRRTTFSTVYCFTDGSKISFFTGSVGAMLARLVGSSTAREMVLQALDADKGLQYVGFDFPASWQAGGEGWRYYMLLAGTCVTNNDPTVFGDSRPVSALWSHRLMNEDGRFGRNWERECTIFTGLTGRVSVPDDDSSTTWVDGVTRLSWLNSFM